MIIGFQLFQDDPNACIKIIVSPFSGPSEKLIFVSLNPRYIRTKNGRYEINNPYITYDPNYKPLMVCVLKDTTQISRHPNHDVYRDNIHIITSRCKKLGIENPELKCEQYFTKNEL